MADFEDSGYAIGYEAADVPTVLKGPTLCKTQFAPPRPRSDFRIAAEALFEPMSRALGRLSGVVVAAARLGSAALVSHAFHEADKVITTSSDPTTPRKADAPPTRNDFGFPQR